MPTKQEIEERVQQLEEENAALQARLDNIVEIAAPSEDDFEEEYSGDDDFEGDDQGED